MGDHGPRQGEGEKGGASLAASGPSDAKPPALTAVPDLTDPLWAKLGRPEQLHIVSPTEGPGATFEIIDFNPATDQLAILADPTVTSLAAVTTLSSPDAAATRLRLEFLWADLPQGPGYHLTVLVHGAHTFQRTDILQIAAAARPADWITLHPTNTETVTIAAPDFDGPLHLVEISQVYDQDDSAAQGSFLEHTSRFYIYTAPNLGAADIIAPFSGEEWERLAQMPGVKTVYEVALPSRLISPDTDVPRLYPLTITDRDLASSQSLNFHY